MAFWEKLQTHQLWQRENLPTIDTKQGMALLIWLLKNEGRPVPIGRLYKESRSSEPTMRECVKAFVALDLARIETTANDTRYRLLYATPKLQQTIQEYRMRLFRLGNSD